MQFMKIQLIICFESMVKSKVLMRLPLLVLTSQTDCGKWISDVGSPFDLVVIKVKGVRERSTCLASVWPASELLSERH